MKEDLRNEVVTAVIAHAGDLLHVARLLQEGRDGVALGKLTLEDAGLRELVRRLIDERDELPEVRIREAV